MMLTEREAWYELFVRFTEDTPACGVCNELNKMYGVGFHYKEAPRITEKTYDSMKKKVTDSLSRYPNGKYRSAYFGAYNPSNSKLRADWCWLQYLELSPWLYKPEMKEV